MSDQIRWQHVTVTHEGGTLRVSGTHIDWQDIHSALKQHFGKLRGWDEIQLRPVDGKPRILKVPRTTFADVATLAVFWSSELAKAPRHHSQMQGRREQWAAMVDQVQHIVTGHPPEQLFPKNREFWRAMNSVAIAIGVEHDNLPPSKLDLVVGFFSDAVGDAVAWVGRTLEKGAAAVGRTLGRAAGGVAEGAGLKPILIGAGVVAGAAILIPALSKRSPRKKGAVS